MRSYINKREREREGERGGEREGGRERGERERAREKTSNFKVNNVQYALTSEWCVHNSANVCNF